MKHAELEPAQSKQPLHVVNLTLTGRCNLNCDCCYQKRRKDDLSTEVLLGLIDDIAQEGTQLLMLPGGEPLLRGDLEELIARASGHGIQTYLASNATLITAERATELKNQGLTGCCVGVEVFDPNSPKDVDRKALAKTIRGLNIFRNSGLETFANLIVTRQNIDLLSKTIRFLAGLGINRFTLLRPKPSQNGVWFEESRLRAEDLYKLQKIKSALEADIEIDVINSDCALGSLQGALPLELLEEEGVEPCLAGTRYLSIDSNGDVYPCAYLRTPEFLAGNIQETRLSDVRKSDVFAPFQEATLEGHCGTCPMQKHCGGCRAIAYHDSGNILGEDSDCQWGSATQKEAIKMGVAVWMLLIWRFFRYITHTRRKPSAKRANRIMQTNFPVEKNIKQRSSRLLILNNGVS